MVRRGQRGQTSVEYLGIIVVVGAMLAILIGAGTGIGSEVTRRIGCVIQLTNCPGDGGGPTAQLPPGAGPPPSAPPPVPEPPKTPEQNRLERLQLLRDYRDIPLSEFIEKKNDPNHDQRMDWTDDGCSAPVVGSSGKSFDFTQACQRHDYGYRNSKDLGVFKQDKKAIDDRFLQDMKDHCATRASSQQGACYRWAYTFYAGVRAFGGF